MQRENLNPVEKAMGIKKLVDNYGMSQEQIAQKLGKNRSTVTNWLRILNLEPRVLEMAKEGKLSDGHCKALLAITDPEKKSHIKESVAEQKRKHVLYRNIENTFQNFFGSKVKVDAGKRRGKIIIEYTSNDDLERILGLIK